MQDVAQIGSSQFSVGFPLQAGPATVVNGVVHEHSRANALSSINRAQQSCSSKALKEVKNVTLATVLARSLAWAVPGLGWAAMVQSELPGGRIPSALRLNQLSMVEA